MLTKNVILCVAAASCFAITGLTSQAADAEPEAVKKFKSTITANDKTILRAAHPLGKYKEATFDADGYKLVKAKHQLSYTVTWTGKEEKEKKDFDTTFQFLFTLTQDGAIDELEITVPKDTCPSKAFKAGNIAAGVFRAQVKKRLEEVTDDEELLKKLKKMDADELLAVWLKYADRKPKK